LKLFVNLFGQVYIPFKANTFLFKLNKGVILLLRDMTVYNGKCGRKWLLLRFYPGESVGIFHQQVLTVFTVETRDICLSLTCKLQSPNF
jgi:hypothetical protein